MLESVFASNFTCAIEHNCRKIHNNTNFKFMILTPKWALITSKQSICVIHFPLPTSSTTIHNYSDYFFFSNLQHLRASCHDLFSTFLEAETVSRKWPTTLSSNSVCNYVYLFPSVMIDDSCTLFQN